MRLDVDPDGLVRTVLVKYTIPGRQPGSRGAKEIEVMVQRLVLICSKEEMDADIQAAEKRK